MDKCKKQARSVDTRLYILCIALACQNIRLNFHKFWNHAVVQTLTEICRNNNMEKKSEEELSQFNRPTDWVL